MFRKTSGAILCPSCGRLTNADAPVCLVCGRRNPGMWGFGGPLARLFRSWNFTNAVTAACIALYVVSLVFDPRGALTPRGLFDIFSPTGGALEALGMTGSVAWLEGRWWTLLTAIYLHGGVLHILFNVLWIRQLGPEVEKLYGPARLVVIFTVSGAAGFVVSNSIGVPFTIGASGAIFGLLGAIVAFGRKRGGVFGQMVLRQYGQWALVLFVFGFFMPGVNNWAHAGGFAGGFASGLVLSLAEHRTETALFFLALWTAFTG
jgi:rhomboid protease GluP